MNQRKIILLISLFLSLFLLISSVNAITISSPDNFKSTIESASSNSIIELDSNVNEFSLNASNVNITINRTLTIQSSNSSKKAIINLNQLGRAFNITNNGNLTLINITIKNGTSNQGGAIFNQGYLTLIACTFSENSAYIGGAISNNLSAILTVNNSIFIKNEAIVEIISNDGGIVTIDEGKGFGGAIFNWGSNNIYILDSEFVDNGAYYNGGAIYNEESTLLINNSNFTSNFVVFNPEDPDDESLWGYALGGAICNVGKELVLYNSNFNDNFAYYGGAIDNYVGDINIRNCNFNNNSAVIGGAIENWGGASIIIDDSNFTNNLADYDGGAIDNYEAGIFQVSNCIFENNIAHGLGGAIDNYGSSAFIIISCSFNNNTAFISEDYDVDYSGHGGAIANFASESLWIVNSNFTNNSAENVGGAIFNINSTLVTVEGSNFTNNRVITYEELNENINTGYGGAIANEETNMIMFNTLFYNNSAYSAGAIDNNNGEFTIVNCSFISNHVLQFGGAIGNWGENASFTIFNSNFTNNVAVTGGGAINNFMANYFLIENSNFTGNHVTGGVPYFDETLYLGNGGAILNELGSGLFRITNSSFEFNNANQSGGSIANIQSKGFEILNSSFTSNFAGLVGGAIYNHDSEILIVLSSNFTNNSVFIEYENNEPIFNYEVDTGIGGGIANNGSSIEIYDSKFINNSAYSGGAIDNFNGSFFLNNSFFEDNYCAKFGGAIENWVDSEFTILNCNFTNNIAIMGGGAVDNWGGTYLIIVNTNFIENKVTGGRHYDESVFTGDGGAIINEDGRGVFDITNCSFIDNYGAKNGGAICNINSSGLNVLNSTFINNCAVFDGGAFYNFNSVNFYISNSKFENNSLTDINLINDTYLGSGGAINNFNSSLSVDNSNFTNNTNKGIGGSGAAISNWGGGNITVNASIFENNYVTRYGSAIYAQLGTVTLINSNFSNNIAGDSGGAIYVQSEANVNINNCNLIKNTALIGNGGAIVNLGLGIVNIERSRFINNSATMSDNGNNGLGGAIFNNDGHMIIDNSYFTYNSANNGGAIYSINDGSTISDVSKDFLNYILVNNSKFENNMAIEDGGAIAKTNSEVQVFVSDFINNMANNRGGAIFTNNGGSLIIQESQFSRNIAVYHGGAIFNGNGTVNIVRSDFNINNARGNSNENINTSSGGAIYNKGDIFIIDSNFKDNNANSNGGAIAIGENGALNVTGSYFLNNVAGDNGGAISISANSSLSCEGCQYNVNMALNGNGGAIYCNSTNCIINYCVLVNNKDNKNIIIYNDASISISANYNWWGNNQISNILNYNVNLNSYYTMILNSTLNGKNITTSQSFTFNYYFVLNGTNNKGNINKFPYYEVSITFPNYYIDTFDCRYDRLFIYNSPTPKNSLSIDGKLDNVVHTLRFNIVKENPSLSISKVTGTYNNEIIIKATLNDQSGKGIANKYIYFYVKGVCIGSAITNSLGVATIKYTPKNIGNYNIMVSFDSDSAYNNKVAYYNMKVSKGKTTIIISKFTGKFNKQGVIKVNIKDKSKKPVAKKVIHFYINGKKIGVAKTNSKGQATLKSLINVKGLVTIRVEFQGSTLYYKSKASKKVKI